MIVESSTKQKKTLQREKAYFAHIQRNPSVSSGKLEQPGRRYQRRGKPREGLRLDS